MSTTSSKVVKNFAIKKVFCSWHRVEKKVKNKCLLKIFPFFSTQPEMDLFVQNRKTDPVSKSWVTKPEMDCFQKNTRLLDDVTGNGFFFKAGKWISPYKTGNGSFFQSRKMDLYKTGNGPFLQSRKMYPALQNAEVDHFLVERNRKWSLLRQKPETEETSRITKPEMDLSLSLSLRSAPSGRPWRSIPSPPPPSSPGPPSPLPPLSPEIYNNK